MSNSTHRVQGLNNDEVAADWPAITDREITWLSERFAPLAGACRLLWHSPRPMSAAAIVESDTGRVFVKRHHGSVRTAAGLGEEHRFIRHLADHGVPVVEVLRDRDGATAVEHEGWTYELHGVGHGQDLYRDAPSWTLLTDTAQAHEAGRMLARLHLASASYHAPQRTTHLLVARDDLIRAADPIAALQAGLDDRPGLAAYLARQDWQADLQRAVLPWHDGLAERLQAEPRLWAHNDWHVSNLLWRQDGRSTVVDTVLDLGLASPTSALFDLATAIERNAIAWLALESGEAAVRVDIALALLAGYRAIVPLSAERVHLLADLLPIVQLDFALSEVEYFEAVTHSPANADVAYHTFLLGHADWFSSPAGQGLLKALHAAA
ncbi:MAG: phosphotransferase [Stenotrophomonas sp.]|uniref:phosphotransferase enzyme family protein n=1 Tax=Stenotrophomonas sp. TaxID=69392 RepID=UPI0028A84F8C|nr:phosphotransferase [Stenotrophomonas sp.]